jgi:uncharacterized protein YggU (UPF0235/DUF167 family)
MIFEITVRPGSKRFRIYKSGSRLMADLEQDAEKNRANIELISRLSKLLGCPVRIISGQASRKKRLSAAIGEAEWSAFLAGLG